MSIYLILYPVLGTLNASFPLALIIICSSPALLRAKQGDLGLQFTHWHVACSLSLSSDLPQSLFYHWSVQFCCTNWPSPKSFQITFLFCLIVLRTDYPQPRSPLPLWAIHIEHSKWPYHSVLISSTQLPFSEVNRVIPIFKSEDTKFLRIKGTFPKTYI